MVRGWTALPSARALRMASGAAPCAVPSASAIARSPPLAPPNSWAWLPLLPWIIDYWPIEFGGPAAPWRSDRWRRRREWLQGLLKLHSAMGQKRSVGRGRTASTGDPRPGFLACDTFDFPADVAGVHVTLHPGKGVTMSELRNRMIQDLETRRIGSRDQRPVSSSRAPVGRLLYDLPGPTHGTANPGLSSLRTRRVGGRQGHVPADLLWAQILLSQHTRL